MEIEKGSGGGKKEKEEEEKRGVVKKKGMEERANFWKQVRKEKGMMGERLSLVSEQYRLLYTLDSLASNVVEHSKPTISRQKYLPSHHSSLTHTGGFDLLSIFHPVII